MESKKFTQFGTFSVVILGPLFLVTLVLAIVLRPPEIMMRVVLGFVSLTMGICLLIFYKITIIVDDTHLSFKLGAGLVSKKYPLSSIKECKAVKNNPLYGIGIRLLSNGWLYNVSGLEAIELTFKNKSSRIRIGTDKPEEIALLVSSKTGTGPANTVYEKDFIEKSGYWLAVIVIASLFLPVILILTGRRENEVIEDNSGFEIKGMYGLTVNYLDIKKLDTLTVLPKISRRTNGYALGQTLKGNFRLSDKSNVKLFVSTDSPPFIFIETSEHKIYFSYKDPALTRKLYNKTKKHINTKPV